MTVTIIHNPNCSKSSEALDLLLKEKASPQVVKYLDGELTRELLMTIIAGLDVHPKNLIRTKEPEFQDLRVNLEDAEQIIAAILKHPKLLERPIVLKGVRAIIARPPEKVLSF